MGPDKRRGTSPEKGSRCGNVFEEGDGIPRKGGEVRSRTPSHSRSSTSKGTHTSDLSRERGVTDVVRDRYLPEKLRTTDLT